MPSIWFMPWPGTVKTPSAEEIIGMKPEDLKAKLDGAATKDDLTAIKTEVTSSLADLKKTLEGLTAKPAGSEGGEGGDNGGGDGGEPDATVALISDPTKFVGKQLEPLQKAQMETQAQLGEMRARQNPALAGAFTQFGTELIESANKLPLAMRAQPGFWDWHIRAILGDKMVKGEIREGKFPSLIGSSSVVPNVTGSTKDANHGFSAQQVQWFNEHKIPLESARAITNMYDDGEPINQSGYKTYKTAVAANA